MNAPPGRPGVSETPDGGRPTALRGRRLGAVRAAWVAVASLAVALSGVGLPALYDEFSTLSVYDPGVRGSVRDNLTHLGLSVDFYAAYLLALGIVLSVACFVVAAVVFWRRSDEPMALFAALLLVLLGATFSGSIGALGALSPIWEWLNSVLNALSLVSVFMFFYLFPDGRFVPRWTRWLAVLYIAYVMPTSLFPNAPFGTENLPVLPYALLLSSWLLTGVYAQVYRYRRVSTPSQRQQTKWVIFGFAAALVGYVGVISLQLIFPSLEPGTLADLAGAAAVCGFMLLIPLSFGFAILRYRLYDIDLIINRTLVYGAITATLALVYAGGVVLLQTLFRTLTGQESQLAIVASTLAIAALFGPLRRRIQNLIDRRFYRKKYDAAKTLAEFSIRLKKETDLDRLAPELLGVIEDTVQPAHASLWLRPSESGEPKDGG